MLLTLCVDCAINVSAQFNHFRESSRKFFITKNISHLLEIHIMVHIYLMTVCNIINNNGRVNGTLL